MGVRVREKVNGSGEWWVFVTFRGKRKARKIGSRKAAKDVAAKIEANMAVKAFKLEDPDGRPQVLLREYAKTWLAGHVRNNLKVASYSSYQGKLNHHILPRFGDHPLGKVTRGEIREFCHEKMAGGLSAGSVRTLLIIVSSLFNHAIEDGLLTDNPASKPGRYLKVPCRQGSVEFLTPEEGPRSLKSRETSVPGSTPSS